MYENTFMGTEGRFLLNMPTQNQPPDSRLQDLAKASFAFLATKVANVRT